MRTAAGPRPLPTATPTSQGIEPAGIAGLLEELDADSRIEPHSLVIMRRGSVVASGWWRPFSSSRLQRVHSISKSFTSTALGLAIDEGLLSLDDPVVELVWDARSFPRDNRGILVRHLLSMASGHSWDTWHDAVGRDPGDPARGFLDLPVDGNPGITFAYNQSCTYTLAAILQRLTGQRLSEYLRPRLFDPIGIGDVVWSRYDGAGELGYGGLHLQTDALARFGELYRQHGRWGSTQVLPAGWVHEASRTHVATPGGPGPDWGLGYGYQFWISRHGFRADGAFGQFCLVLPDQHLVVAMTAATLDMQAVLDAIWQHLLPVVQDRPLAAAADEDDLLTRLNTLAIPTQRDLRGSPDQVLPWLAGSFEVVSAGGRPPFDRILLNADPTGGTWRLTLDAGDDRVTISFRPSAWSVTNGSTGSAGSLPVAVTGGWRADGDLELHLLFLETPHRLLLTCSSSSSTAHSRWFTEPPHGDRLADLRAHV